MSETNEVKELLGGIESRLKDAIAERDAQIKARGEADEKLGARIDALGKEYQGAIEEQKAAVAEVRDEVTEALSKFEAARTSNREVKALGDRFAASEEYKAYIEGGLTGNSRAFDIGGTLGGAKAAFSNASLGDTATYMWEVERFAEYVADPNRTRFVRELLPTYGTDSGSVEFVRETSFTNNAGMVPEYTGGESTSKPDSALGFEVVSVPLKTMAHGMPITRQAAADERQIRSYIESRLLYGLRLKEDQQLLYGTGTGNEINGILTDSDIQSYSQTGDETLIDAIRKAITKSYVEEYRPTGIVLNHEDWQDIELEKGSDDHYIWVNVTTDNGSRLWGLPVVATNAITAGTVLVGDFQRGSAVHDREAATLRMTDSHQDYFMKNILQLLAEERIAQSILRPNAFVEVTKYTAP